MAKGENRAETRVPVLLFEASRRCCAVKLGDTSWFTAAPVNRTVEGVEVWARLGEGGIGEPKLKKGELEMIESLVIWLSLCD